MNETSGVPSPKKGAAQKPKKIPVRRCTGCGESFPKKELIRVVRSPEGDVSVDLVGKKSGRGAYVCRNPQCLKKALRSGRIAKNLECEIPAEVMDAIEAEVAACGVGDEK